MWYIAARSMEGERGRVSESVLEALRSERRGGADLVRVLRAARDGMRTRSGGASESMLQIDGDGEDSIDVLL